MTRASLRQRRLARQALRPAALAWRTRSTTMTWIAWRRLFIASDTAASCRCGLSALAVLRPQQP